MKTGILIIASLFLARLPNTAWAECCFGIGYGAMMKPCCLTIHESKQTKEQCIPPKTREPLLGGAVGWTSGRCPSDAEEANEIIQKMRTETQAVPPPLSLTTGGRSEGANTGKDDEESRSSSRSKSSGFLVGGDDDHSTAMATTEEGEGKEKKVDLLQKQQVSSSSISRVENLEAEMRSFENRLGGLERAKTDAGYFVIVSVGLGCGISVLGSWLVTRKAWASRSESTRGRSLLVE